MLGDPDRPQPGQAVPDPVYVGARRTLLNALEALGRQRASVVLVGAQAIYVLTGEGGLAVSPFTTDADLMVAVAPFTADADLALDPRQLEPEPLIEEAMTQAGFRPAVGRVGTWVLPDSSEVDLLVPEAVGGPGRRAARIPPHAEGVARKARGLEAALVDQTIVTITALEVGDPRRIEATCAGPAALLVAKLVKIADRQSSSSRLEDKDAYDVLRLLRAFTAEELADRLRRLRTADLSAEVTESAIALLDELFGAPDATGSQMAVRTTAGLEDPAIIAASCVALAGDLLAALGSLRDIDG